MVYVEPIGKCPGITSNRTGRSPMPVERVGDKYRCNICGNLVVVEEAGGGTLVCCGEDMERVDT